MEQWKHEIEKLLARNRTIDKWIIRDFVLNEDQSAHKAVHAAMSHLLTAMRLMCVESQVIPEAELKERLNRSFEAAGMPREMLDSLFKSLHSDMGTLPPWAEPLFKEEDGEQPKETAGDDE